MTGTQSLSAAQVRTIARELELHDRLAGNDPRSQREPGHGKVVTVVIHQAMANGHGDGRKRVQFHRAHADSVNFGVMRDGQIILAVEAA